MFDRAKALEPKLVEWRRDFHMHPELGFAETRTAGRVAATLAALGYRVRSGVGRTGVVAERGEGSPVLAIRADMDALPIQDAKQVPYASQVPGVMHACGHDAHIAIALGTATLLAGESFPGTVRFLFQPAEEVEDKEGISGAPRMIADGAIDGVEMVLALHVAAMLPVGTVELGAGPASAGVDTFYATLIGRGGHGASPHLVVDPIHIAAHVVLALNTIVSRRLNPIAPAVVSVCSIHAGQASNVIPEQVELTGTIRYMDPEVQQQIHDQIEQATSIARTMGGDFELRIETGYPPMINHPLATDLIREAAIAVLDAEHVRPATGHMGAEDFGFFSARSAGAMFALGCRIEGDERRHHSESFDMDERCLPIGAAILAEAALRFLRPAA